MSNDAESERKVRNAVEALARFRDPDFNGEPRLIEIVAPLFVLDSVAPDYLARVLATVDPTTTARAMVFLASALAGRELSELLRPAPGAKA
jgi:hypothetical protein